MDINDNIDSLPRATLIFLTFIHQTPRRDPALQNELYELCLDLNLKRCSDRDVFHADLAGSTTESEGELETDGHSPFIPRNRLQDVLPQVHFELPMNAEEAYAVQEVAQDLKRIADELNLIIETRAQNLVKKMSENNSLQSWKSLLAQTVENLQKEVPGFHTENMAIALTFSLVKAVCERAPTFLRGLYNVLMQCTFINRPR